MIEPALVNPGTLIALQRDQWREARAANAQQIEFIKKAGNDIEDAVETLTAVSEFGYSAAVLLDGALARINAGPSLSRSSTRPRLDGTVARRFISLS